MYKSKGTFNLNFFLPSLSKLNTVLCRAKQCQEKFSNLLIFVTAADENLIHQNTANTTSLI